MGTLNSFKIYLRMLVFIGMPFFCPAQQVRHLSEQDYKSWAVLTNDNLSENGNWLSCSLTSNGIDSLLIIDTNGNKTIKLANCRHADFIGETLAISLDSDNTLNIIDLKNLENKAFQDVKRYGLCGKYGYYYLRADNKMNMTVCNASGNIILQQDDVVDIAYEEATQKLVFSQYTLHSTRLGVFSIQKPTVNYIAKDIKGTCTNLTWQIHGKSLCFLQNTDGKIQVGFVGVGKPTLHILDGQHLKMTGKDIFASISFPLKISMDGKRVFFASTDKVTTTTNSLVQVWNANDPDLFIASLSSPKLFVWWPEKGEVVQLTDNQHRSVMLDGLGKYALIFDPVQYEPQSRLNGPTDLYLWDLEEPCPKLWISKQNTSSDELYISPGGKYILYKRENKLWRYDLKKGKHSQLFNEKHSDLVTADDMDVVGWRENDKAVLLTCHGAVWELDFEGNLLEKLSPTQSENTFKIISCRKTHYSKMNYNGPVFKDTFRSGEHLLLEESNTMGSLFYHNAADITSDTLIISGRRHISQIKGIDCLNTISFIEEEFNVPPSVSISRNGRTKKIFKSNTQHWKYDWGHSTVISYNDSLGRLFHGALFYPAGYSEKQYYPMVVQIYQKQSDKFNRYVNPSQFNEIGFNISNFTSRGYFVFLPDIFNESGNPGASALNCVLSGVKAILSKATVDPCNIGIFGHSFGGYETTFILTNTGIFKTAVVGSAITDYNSGYLYVNTILEKPNVFKYEYGQLRMGKSLFEDKEGYYRNSPVYAADKITTPILSWAGQQDTQVHYFQAMELYVALRRLNKEHIMLLYPEEGHAVYTPESQADLTKKTEQWFDYYLKGSPRPAWMQ